MFKGSYLFQTTILSIHVSFRENIYGTFFYYERYLATMESTAPNSRLFSALSFFLLLAAQRLVKLEHALGHKITLGITVVNQGIDPPDEICSREKLPSENWAVAATNPQKLGLKDKQNPWPSIVLYLKNDRKYIYLVSTGIFERRSKSKSFHQACTWTPQHY